VALDNEDRAFLEKTIDSAIGQVPDLMRFVKKKIPPSQIKYKQGQLLTRSLRIWLDGAVKKKATDESTPPDERVSD